MEPEEITNFDVITALYEEWIEDTSNDSLGLEIINTAGYSDWLVWMQENKPEKLI